MRAAAIILQKLRYPSGGGGFTRTGGTGDEHNRALLALHIYSFSGSGYLVCIGVFGTQHEFLRVSGAVVKFLYRNTFHSFPLSSDTSAALKLRTCILFYFIICRTARSVKSYQMPLSSFFSISFLSVAYSRAVS